MSYVAELIREKEKAEARAIELQGKLSSALEENERVRLANVEGKMWVDSAAAEIKDLTSRLEHAEMLATTRLRFTEDSKKLYAEMADKLKAAEGRLDACKRLADGLLTNADYVTHNIGEKLSALAAGACGEPCDPRIPRMGVWGICQLAIGHVGEHSSAIVERLEPFVCTYSLLGHAGDPCPRCGEGPCQLIPLPSE